MQITLEKKLNTIKGEHMKFKKLLKKKTYFNFLEENEEVIINKLEKIMINYKVQVVGSGYIDCIIMKDNLEDFIKEVGDLGILISGASWWCYVNPTESKNTDCPHGMGGPSSIYYEGWFSELQNDFYELDKKSKDKVISFYDVKTIYYLNMRTMITIKKILNKPFKYTSNDYIDGNKCVQPGLWLLVPRTWKNKVTKVDN